MPFLLIKETRRLEAQEKAAAQAALTLAAQGVLGQQQVRYAMSTRPSAITGAPALGAGVGCVSVRDV